MERNNLVVHFLHFLLTGLLLFVIDTRNRIQLDQVLDDVSLGNKNIDAVSRIRRGASSDSIVTEETSNLCQRIQKCDLIGANEEKLLKKLAHIKKGPRGEVGPVGPKGEVGFDGLPGVTGAKGAIGSRGYPGIKGEPGYYGQKGEPGQTTVLLGIKGKKGESGREGRKGEPGISYPSYQSLKSIIPAPRNTRGEKGEKGEMGLVGVEGLQGLDGEKGVKGERGPWGRMGQKGMKGEPGREGVEGRCNLELFSPTLQDTHLNFPASSTNNDNNKNKTFKCVFFGDETQVTWCMIKAVDVNINKKT